jgi:predicted transposase/invertase (TIGR01784 family)
MAKENPHDVFFKATFSQKSIAEAFLKEFLPNNIKAILDISSIQLSTNSYIDEELSENFADLVYDCHYKSKSKAQIAILLEHKSFKVKYPHFQLLRYLLNAWEQNEKQKQEFIPIIPIVVFHGKGHWDYTPLRKYFKSLNLELERFIPEFDYLICDISNLEDSEILSFENHFLALSTIMMKYSRVKNYFLSIGKPIINLMDKLLTTDESLSLQSYFGYLYHTNDLTITEIITIFRENSIKISDTAMTTWDRAVKEGKIETSIKYIKGYLTLGLTPEAIAALIDEPVSEVQKIIAKVQTKK